MTATHEEAAISAAHTFRGSLNPNDPDGRALIRHELANAGMIAGPSTGAVAAEPFTAASFTLGQTVAIFSRGRVRQAIVTKIGRRNVTTVYTTPGALFEARQYRGSISPATVNFTRPSVAFADVVGVALDGVCQDCGERERVLGLLVCSKCHAAANAEVAR